jgi:hypothetical protein
MTENTPKEVCTLDGIEYTSFEDMKKVLKKQYRVEIANNKRSSTDTHYNLVKTKIIHVYENKDIKWHI